MHGPDLASRFQNLTTQHDFVRIPQEGNVVIPIPALPPVSSQAASIGAPAGRRRGTA